MRHFLRQWVCGSNAFSLPALVLRPTDKQTVERTFGAIRSLLFEALPGYTGVDVYDRGADPEADATHGRGDGEPDRDLDRRSVAEPAPRRALPGLGPG
ncbi:hypothetical protein AB0F15_20395 [Amycolatopsis sp. NPDC026612]|uniref:hypothetical protein n=1 Tax=Amycolatopsis sp. NPDC026612 TaxID=3155466 RepID=UPI0033D2DC75